MAYATCLNIPAQKELLKWLKEWRVVKSPISANQLIEGGWKQGIDLGNELKRLRYEFLDI